MKICCICHNNKPLTEYHKKASEKDGISSKCKSCCRDYARSYRAENLELVKQKSANYHAENKDLINEKKKLHRIKPATIESRKAYNIAYADRGKHLKLMRLYGISLEEYNQMLSNQGGVCAICREVEVCSDPRAGRTIGLAVDHDHTTGKIRGILCSKCNKAIGLLKDDTSLLASAIDYLNKSNTHLKVVGN
jgi:hypothetical protein